MAHPQSGLRQSFHSHSIASCAEVKVLVRLPRSWLPVGHPYGHVFAFTEDGQVVEDLQDPTGTYPETTGATETESRLYIHSLHADTIGWMRR